MVSLKNEKSIRKPRNVKIDPDTLHEAHVEALRVKKPLGQWFEEAIKEKLKERKGNKSS